MVMKINSIGNPLNAQNTSLFRNDGNRKGVFSTPAGQASNDRLALSRQALALIENATKMQQLNAQKNNGDSSEADMLDTLNESMKILKTCSLIASRIMAGDKVPLKDLKYLMEHDMKGYQLAMAMRKQKAKPKEWKSAIPEEEQAAQETSGGTQTQSTETQSVQSSQGVEASGSSTSSGESSGNEA